MLLDNEITLAQSGTASRTTRQDSQLFTIILRKNFENTLVKQPDDPSKSP